MPIQLRGEKCAFRREFLRWILFCAFLAVAPVWAVFVNRGIIGGDIILVGPEYLVGSVIYRYAPESGLAVLALPLLVLRLIAAFAWGVSLLRRGKHAPYAEILWLLAGCTIVLLWIQPLLGTKDIRFSSGNQPKFYAIMALLMAVGAVIFLLQRLKPPAWKRKTSL